MRNAAWMKLITKEVDAGNAFIMVGFYHLFSPEGLIVRLRARGYKIDRR